MEEKNLKNKALSGLIWTFVESFGTRIIGLVIQIMLARLLLPKDFGIIGMITIFIAISQTLLDSGFQQALIREKKVTEKEYSTVFFFNLIMAFVLYWLLFFSAPFISDFYHTPILTSILRVLGLVLLINSFGMIQRTMLTRNFNFKAQMKIMLISSAISGAVAIFMAWKGYGVWSLVAQQLVNQFIQATLLTLMNRWIPVFIFDIIAFKKFFKFGWKLMVSSLIDTSYQNIFYVIIGKFYSPTDLGYYTNSQKFNDIPVMSMTGAIQKVTYPLLSKLNQNDTRLKNSYKMIIRAAAGASFAMMLALGASASYLIPFVFGKNWIPSVPYFQILCLAGMFYPVNAINLNILKVKGRSDLFLSLEIIKKIVGIAFIAVAILLKTGILGLVWAGVLATLFNTSINIIVSARLIQYSYFEQLKDLYQFLLTALVMAAVMLLLGNLLTLATIFMLIIEYIVGGLVYFVVGRYIFKLPEIDKMIGFVKSKVKKQSV